SMPFKTVSELIAYARENPKKLNYGSGGHGSSHQMVMEMFRSATDIDITHVPYNGSAAGMIDLMGGRVDAVFVNVPGSLPHIRAGRVKAIALAGRARMRVLAEGAARSLVEGAG
ncbi:MAG: tripartite tricarboxylate transporter substrate-binding protein, partial [Deltaproteobacteria bacterium]